MPTYQYACTSCGHQFEAVQSFSDEALSECPECGQKLRKVYSAVGIVFKGSGFYRTDSRSDKSGSSSSSAPSSGPAKSTPAKESTPAAPAAATPAASSSSGSGSPTGAA